LLRTYLRRPDLLENAELSKDDLILLEEIKRQTANQQD
jgi:tRNA G37 N-methylase TrmD